MRARPLADVPRPVWLVLAVALGAHLWLQAPRTAPSTRLPAPPDAGTLRALSLGEPVALAKALMLYVQSAEGGTPLRQVDYAHLSAWLERIVALDPRGQYPLLAASQVYAAVHDQPRQRIMLDLVQRQFELDPDRRWPWLAHAVLVARHQLNDLALARRYAQAIRERTSPAVLPPWAQQMEVFILEDMNDADSARLLIGAMIAGGQVRDPNELRLLERRLKQLEAPEPRTMR